MSTILIGIAGGTGSGKTTLTRHLKEHFGPEVTVIGHDSYYKRQVGKTYEERTRVNYDHPDAFDTGISTKEMNERLMAVAQGITPQLFLLLSQTVNYAVEMLEEADRREFITAGTNQLLKLPEFRDADKAHQLMSFLADDKEKLPVPDEGPMKILIGPENVSDALKDTSVVVASYDIGDDMRGLIGVVGPTRMDYATVAARLTGFADGLTRLFGKKEPHELPPKEDTDT